MIVLEFIRNMPFIVEFRLFFLGRKMRPHLTLYHAISCMKYYDMLRETVRKKDDFILHTIQLQQAMI